MDAVGLSLMAIGIAGYLITRRTRKSGGAGCAAVAGIGLGLLIGAIWGAAILSQAIR